MKEHRERERQKPGYDHEKVKEETCHRVAAIRARRPKCSLGQKCKDQLQSDCNWTRTQNHLVLKRTLNHLAKWLSVHLRTN